MIRKKSPMKVNPNVENNHSPKTGQDENGVKRRGIFSNYKCMSSTRLMVLTVLCLQNSIYTVLRRYSQGVLSETYSKVSVSPPIREIWGEETNKHTWKDIQPCFFSSLPFLAQNIVWITVGSRNNESRVFHVHDFGNATGRQESQCTSPIPHRNIQENGYLGSDIRGHEYSVVCGVTKYICQYFHHLCSVQDINNGCLFEYYFTTQLLLD